MSCNHAWGKAEFRHEHDQFLSRCICGGAEQVFANEPYVTRQLNEKVQLIYGYRAYRPVTEPAEPKRDMELVRKLFEPLYPRYDRGGTPNMLWLATSIALFVSGLWVML